MSQKQTTSLFLYVPIVLLGFFIVYFVFTENFKQGVLVGENAPPPAEPRQKAGEQVDYRALAQNADLATEGKTLYQINCASCHGTDGQGDGPRAAGLNPPPRNYKTEQFKFGSDIVAIYNTLTQGSPGTSMPSFALLPVKDRFAMAHYVRRMVPEPTPTTDEILAQLPESSGGGGEAAAAMETVQSDSVESGARIPIQFAMQRMAVEPIAMRAASPDISHPGAALYAKHCAQCHGAKGEGIAVDWISVAPYHYARTQSLANPGADWYADRDVFTKLVIDGLPGREMPGKPYLTRAEINNLYEFVRSLAQ